MQISKPPRLKPGDVVGVVAPSYEVASRRSVVEQGFQRLAAYGFQIREGKHLWSRLTGRAATRAEQLADLHNLWADPAVKAIFCATGGLTAITLVDGLDYDLIARHPKIFLGMSDISILHGAILAKTGLVTFHTANLGEGLGSSDADLEAPHLLQLITRSEPAGPLPAWAGRVRCLRPGPDPGPVRGRLFGGALNCLPHLLGTPYWPKLSDTLLFLEAVNMGSATVLRWLSQLRLAGAFADAKAVLFGHLEGCFKEWPDPDQGLAWALENALGDLALPVYQTVAFGHGVPNVTLPMGIQAAISDGQLVIAEAAVTAV